MSDTGTLAPDSLTLVLASQSSYRRDLLNRLSLPFTTREHTLNERALAAAAPLGQTLPQLARVLARAKAESIASAEPNAHIIASDQIAECDGQILHKPGNRDNAIQQLTQLAGRKHRLLTAVALRLPSGTLLDSLDEHHMHMRALTRREIECYIDADLPLDCCGSYKIESLGISLFHSIVGEDFTAITGLPLLALSKMLRNCGFLVP